MPKSPDGLVLALDQGTSATKACIYEPPGRLLGSASVPVRRRSPQPGAVEQDAVDLVESCRAAARIALRECQLQPSELAAAALANQGESFLLFDGPGKPLGPVIGWQDTRCGDVISRLEAGGAGTSIEERTGLSLHAEFTAPKLAHLLESNPPPRGARFGTLDTWLIYELDPAHPHISDRATASRTMLIGLEEDDWSEDLLALFGVSREILPSIVPCDAPGSMIEIEGHEVPLCCSGYDMGLALLGHACLERGETKATFGTCLGVMAATATDVVRAPGLLTTIAYTSGGRTAFGLDGEIAAAGALVEWALRLGIAGSLEELDALAASVSDARGALMVPAVTGLGAPYWRDDVRCEVIGITEAFGKAEFARAVFDAIAWTLRDVLSSLGRAGVEVQEVRVDGGLTRSAVLLHRCADVCQLPLVRPAQPEATAYGAAALVMLALGSATVQEIRKAAEGIERVEPGRPPSDAETEAWVTAVDTALARPLH